MPKMNFEMKSAASDVLLFLRLARMRMRADNNSTKMREDLFDWLVEQARAWGNGQPIVDLEKEDPNDALRHET